MGGGSTLAPEDSPPVDAVFGGASGGALGGVVDSVLDGSGRSRSTGRSVPSPRTSQPRGHPSQIGSSCPVPGGASGIPSKLSSSEWKFGSDG